MNSSTQNLSLRRKSNLMIMTSISLLLMSFFVALASISLPDARKTRLGINSIFEGFGMSASQTKGFTGIPMTEVDRLDIIRFRKALQAGGVVRDTGVYSSSLGTTLAIKGSLLFEKDSASLKTDSLEKVNTVASLIKDIPNEIVITGFTDSRPVETAPFRSNWALSAARAMAVMNYLASRGVDYKRMRAYGMGPEHPISSNSTEAGRNINSRVEITIAGKMPGETGARAKEIKKEETPPPPIYHYKGYEIPIEEK
jgi:outer membrane protein OmpA-like peptidoglycan-associated protein